MSSLYEDIKQGLQEAIEYERDNLPNVKVNEIRISPLRSYSKAEIRAIRLQQKMTQKVFAAALGVSVKTVEAWESGINSPSGVACRLLELIKQDQTLLEKYAVVVR